MKIINSVRTRICLIFFILYSIDLIPLSGQTVLVNAGARWKYLDDGSDQGIAWRTMSFDDGEWAAGEAELGYGDNDETTVISYGSNPQNKYITYYFRHCFSVEDLSQFRSLSLELLRDDGAIVYLNGYEIERQNMAGGEIDYLTLALSGAGEDEDKFIVSIEDPVNLMLGTNVLAVEIHQSSTTSSDVSFNLKLIAHTEFPDIARKQPYLIYNGNNTEMEILWQMYFSQSCTIQWGTDTQYLLGSAQTTEYGNDHQHKYTIKNLIPDTKYFYRVTLNENFYSGYFKSAVNTNTTSVNFFVYGDSRSHLDIHDQVAAEIIATCEEENFRAILISTGDLVSDGDVEFYWDHYFFNPSYPNTKKLFATIPFQACMGNHENEGVLFKKYFPYPFVGKRYWSFDYGIAHFVIVDQYTNYDPGSAQLTWIENDLASKTNFWNFIILHEPGWSAGTHNNEDDVQNYIQPLCEQYNVHVVFAGHNHNYAHAIVNNVHHITTGGGGASLYGPELIYPNIVATDSAHHFCKVEINGTQMSITVIDITGDILDLFSIGDLSLPVELSKFSASQNEDCILLEWITESEVENLGFVLERTDSQQENWYEIASYTTHPELHGQGSVPYRTEYKFVDSGAIFGKSYKYRLADISYDGEKKYHPTITTTGLKPLFCKLFQNYPNPFNPESNIRFQLSQHTLVVIEIFNLIGQHITRLTDKHYKAGYHELTWNGRDINGDLVPSGVYLYRIYANEFVDTKKMILIR